MQTKNAQKLFILTVFVIVFFSFAFAYLEYNYFLVDGTPYREAKTPIIASLYSYDLFIFIPALALFSFYPLIWQVFSRKIISKSVRKITALGVGSFLLGVVIKDASWHLLRAIVPISTDPLAHQWIRPTDSTATFMGYAEIFGLRIPLWYLALLTLITAIFISLLISQNSNPESNKK